MARNDKGLFMLVPTRKLHGPTIIGDNVKTILLYAQNNHAKMGIEAPLYISVDREGVYRRVVQETKPTHRPC